MRTQRGALHLVGIVGILLVMGAIMLFVNAAQKADRVAEEVEDLKRDILRLDTRLLALERK